MNKPSKPEAEDFDDLSDLYGGPPPTEAEWDAWIAANRDEINESLVRARQDFAEGKATPWNFEEMLADARAEFEKNKKD
jgi:antitoxin ParD1/3/4